MRIVLTPDVYRRAVAAGWLGAGFVAGWHTRAQADNVVGVALLLGVLAVGVVLLFYHREPLELVTEDQDRLDPIPGSISLDQTLDHPVSDRGGRGRYPRAYYGTTRALEPEGVDRG